MFTDRTPTAHAPTLRDSPGWGAASDGRRRLSCCDERCPIRGAHVLGRRGRRVPRAPPRRIHMRLERMPPEGRDTFAPAADLAGRHGPRVGPVVGHHRHLLPGLRPPSRDEALTVRSALGKRRRLPPATRQEVHVPAALERRTRPPCGRALPSTPPPRIRSAGVRRCRVGPVGNNATMLVPILAAGVGVRKEGGGRRGSSQVHHGTHLW